MCDNAHYSKEIPGYIEHEAYPEIVVTCTT